MDRGASAYFTVCSQSLNSLRQIFLSERMTSNSPPLPSGGKIKRLWKGPDLKSLCDKHSPAYSPVLVRVLVTVGHYEGFCAWLEDAGYYRRYSSHLIHGLAEILLYNYTVCRNVCVSCMMVFHPERPLCNYCRMESLEQPDAQYSAWILPGANLQTNTEAALICYTFSIRQSST